MTRSTTGMPRRPFRVVGSAPLRFDHGDPAPSPRRHGIGLVTRRPRRAVGGGAQRAAVPPSTLLSAPGRRGGPSRSGRRIPAAAFRPVPSVDAALLSVTRRDPPILPAADGQPLCLLRAPAVAVASAGRMEETWTVPDVYLLTEGSQGEVAVPHLTLTFRDSGLELDKADGRRSGSATGRSCRR